MFMSTRTAPRAPAFAAASRQTPGRDSRDGLSGITTRRWRRGSRPRRPAACRCRSTDTSSRRRRRRSTTLPSSSSPAMRTAMEAIAPLETPANTPSSSSSLRVQMIASRLVTKILRSSSEMSMIGGMKPSSSERRPCTGSPCIGSAATIFDVLAERLLQPPPVAHQRAAGAEARDERRDLVELVEVLPGPCRCSGPADWPRCRTDRACRPKVSPEPSPAPSTAPIGAERALGVNDLRAIHAQQLRALGRDVLGHHHLQLIALDVRRSSPARCRCCRRSVRGSSARARARPVSASSISAVDAVLDRARRIARLQLGPDAHARLGDRRGSSTISGVLPIDCTRSP